MADLTLETLATSLTAKEAAKLVGRHERTIRNAIAAGELKATKTKRGTGPRNFEYRILPSDLQAWFLNDPNAAR